MSVEPGLFCPTCGYNLTGLPENRCPECGRRFDRDALRKLRAAEGEPIYGPPPLIRNGAALFYLSLIRPQRIARALPTFPNTRAVMWYSMCCHGLGLLLIGIGSIDDFLGCMFSPVGLVAFGAWMFLDEIMTALLAAVGPRGSQMTDDYWRGRVKSCSGFSLLTALWIAVVLQSHIRSWWSPASDSLATLMFAIAGVAIAGWWAAALCLIVAASSAGDGRVQARCVIPVSVATLAVAGVVAALAVLWLW